jgi:hypothetical protein
MIESPGSVPMEIGKVGGIIARLDPQFTRSGRQTRSVKSEIRAGTKRFLTESSEPGDAPVRLSA